MCSHSLTVRTLGFHPGSRGSIPRASTNICRDGGIGRRDRLKICYPFGCVGSIPTLGTKLNGVVVESVYTADLKSAGLRPCGFESRPSYFFVDFFGDMIYNSSITTKG